MRLQSTEPAWLGPIPGTDDDPRPFLLPGVRVRFAPIGPKAYRAAGQACVRVLSAVEEGAEPDSEEASDEIARELVRRGILEWEGIGDEDGEPLAVTDASKAAFVGDPRTFLAAEAAYVTPFLLRDAEKNASAGSPNGTSADPMPAKDSADTAPTRERTDAASMTTPASPPAPTPSTSPRRTKPKRSGRS